MTGCNVNHNNYRVSNNSELINSNEVIESVKVVINEKEYIINLENNETAKSFVNYLPQELKMNELNGNEKYIYLSEKFPTNESNPDHIEAGDVMLYGNNCLVIFYKSIKKTDFSYTKLGHIDNLGDLGKGSVKVTISE
jgi:hypothetical protein